MRRPHAWSAARCVRRGISDPCGVRFGETDLPGLLALSGLPCYDGHGPMPQRDNQHTVNAPRAKRRRTRAGPSPKPKEGPSGTRETQPEPPASPPPPRLPLRRWEWVVLAGIILVGVRLRASYLHELVQQPDFDAPMLDPAYHDYWARALASGDWAPPKLHPDPMIPTTPYGRPPVYPHFLALVYRLTGGSYVAARVVQMGVGLVSAFLMWLFARALFGRVVGLIAAAFMAVYWIFIYYEGQLEGPVLEVLCLLVFMHGLRLWVNRPGHARAFATGLVFGLFVLLRPNAILVTPVLLAWMAWVLWRRGELRRLVTTGCLTCVGAALVIAPATIRNYRASGEFCLVTFGGPVNLYMGNNQYADSTTPTIPELIEFTGARTWTGFHYPMIVRGIARKLGKDTITYAEAGRYFKQRAWEYIKNHPGKTAERVVKRALLFWGPMEVTSNDVTHYTKRNSLTLRYMPGFPVVFSLSLLGLLLFATAGHVRGRQPSGAFEDRQRLEMAALIVAFVLAYFATFLPFIVSCRFRVPLTPFLALFAGYALWRVGRFIAAREVAAALLWAGIGAGLLGLCSIRFAPYEPELGYWHLMRGVAYRLKGDFDGAAENFQKAIETGAASKDIMPHVFLAEMRTRQGRGDEAATLYRSALRIDPLLTATCLDRLLVEYAKLDPADPAFPDWPMTLGEDLERLEKTETAIKYYNVMLLKDPGDAEALAHLAQLLIKRGKQEEAVAQYVALGTLLLTQGDVEEGIQRYREALDIDPQATQTYLEQGIAQYAKAAGSGVGNAAFQSDAASPALPIAVGKALEGLGANEVAATYYQAMLLKDAENEGVLGSLARILAKLGRKEEAAQQYVRLGTLLLEQGDVDAAAARYRQALDLDPGNKRANASLGTVKTYQGDLEGALECYEKALESDPMDPSVLNLLGMVLERLGRPDEAVAHYQKALELDPANQSARAGLERARAARGQTDPGPHQ